MHASGRVERADSVHARTHDDAAAEDGDASADAVGEDDGGNGDDEH